MLWKLGTYYVSSVLVPWNRFSSAWFLRFVLYLLLVFSKSISIDKRIVCVRTFWFWIVFLLVPEFCFTLILIGVRAGGAGRRPPQLRKLWTFFGQNAHNSGNSTCEKTKKHQKKRNETATVVPKHQAKCEQANYRTPKESVWSHQVSSTRNPIG